MPEKEKEDQQRQHCRHDDPEGYNAEACRLRHENDALRITKLEGTLSRIFDKLEAFSQRPSWLVLSIITFLASGLGITMTLILAGWHR